MQPDYKILQTLLSFLILKYSRMTRIQVKLVEIATNLCSRFLITYSNNNLQFYIHRFSHERGVILIINGRKFLYSKYW